MKYNTIQHGTAQYSSIQYGTIDSIRIRMARKGRKGIPEHGISIIILTCARALLSSDGMPTMDPSKGDTTRDVTAAVAEATKIAGNFACSFSELENIRNARAVQAGPRIRAK